MLVALTWSGTSSRAFWERCRREERGQEDTAGSQSGGAARGGWHRANVPIRPLRGEERRQEGGAFGGSDATGDLEFVVEPGIGAEVVQRAAGAGPRVAGPEDDPPTLAATRAPAHMGHGSRVTTSVSSGSRHPPMVAAASRRARISACAVGSAAPSRSLWRAATTFPPIKATAPTGTSPPSPAARASARASAMASSSPSGVFSRAAMPQYARSGGQRASGQANPAPAQPVDACNAPLTSL